MNIGITQQLLYLLLLYAVLSDGKLSQTTGLLIAFAILLVAPCLQNLCAPPTPCPGAATNTFATNIL